MATYDVMIDPFETGAWRVIVDDHFTTPKFKSQLEAETYVEMLVRGFPPAFGDRPVKVERRTVFETDDAKLVETQIAHEAFTFTTLDGDTITWDIERVREQVAAGHTVAFTELDEPILTQIRDQNAWVQATVDAADPSKPGIAAVVIVGGQFGAILIDGTHRAVKALQTKQTFCAWMLTAEASRACIVRMSRDGLVP